MKSTDTAVDKGSVFVVHGRDEVAREALYAFLRALGLKVLEWEHAMALTGSASPYNGEVVDAAFRTAQAIVVLFTGDDVAYLRDDLAGAKREVPGFQPRPNVLIEAGMAIQRSRARTVIVQSGVTRVPSDFHGLQEVRYEAAGDGEFRAKLRNRLRSAGCDVNDTGTEWLHAGDFRAALTSHSAP